MNILLVGGHQKARFLTKCLKEQNYDVKVINEDYDWCKMLADEYEVTTVCGDGSSPSVLKNAQADQMDIVVALGNKDAANLLVCEIAKKQFHVAKTIAIAADPKNVRLFQDLGVDRCVSATQYLTEVIAQETISNSFSRYLQLENGRVVICEVVIDEESTALDRKLWEIGLPPQSIISCIIRGEQTIIPQGSTELKANDKAVVLSSSEAMEEAISILTGKKEKRANR